MPDVFMVDPKLGPAAAVDRRHQPGHRPVVARFAWEERSLRRTLRRKPFAGRPRPGPAGGSVQRDRRPGHPPPRGVTGPMP